MTEPGSKRNGLRRALELFVSLFSLRIVIALVASTAATAAVAAPLAAQAIEARNKEKAVEVADATAAPSASTEVRSGSGSNSQPTKASAKRPESTTSPTSSSTTTAAPTTTGAASPTTAAATAGRDSATVPTVGTTTSTASATTAAPTTSATTASSSTVVTTTPTTARSTTTAVPTTLATTTTTVIDVVSPTAVHLKVWATDKPADVYRLENATVWGTIQIRFDAPAGTKSVTFWLDGSPGGNSANIDSSSPFDLSATGDPIDSLALGAGTHSVTARALLANGSTLTETATFTVSQVKGE